MLASDFYAVVLGLAVGVLATIILLAVLATIQRIRNHGP